MKGIIYYKDKNAGKLQLDQIISNYTKLNISIVRQRQTADSAFIRFTNGDTWDLVYISPNSRGRACNIAYIDNTIPLEAIHAIIFPTIKSLPYTAYNYYN